MKVGASMKLWSVRMSVPPNTSTTQMSTVPRNSLTGWARAWRVFTREALRRMAPVTLAKRSLIFFSAVKAFTTRRPPRVSSTWLMVSLQRACTWAERFLRLRPITPISQVISGANASTKSVSFQEMNTMVLT